MSILGIKVLKADASKTFHVRLSNAEGNTILVERVSGGRAANLKKQYTINNDDKHEIEVSLELQTPEGWRTCDFQGKTSLLSYLDSRSVAGRALAPPWNIDVPSSRSQYVVRLRVILSPPTVEGYRFTI